MKVGRRKNGSELSKKIHNLLKRESPNTYLANPHGIQALLPSSKFLAEVDQGFRDLVKIAYKNYDASRSKAHLCTR